jgi:hypothetical protein
MDRRRRWGLAIVALGALGAGPARAAPPTDGAPTEAELAGLDETDRKLLEMAFAGDVIEVWGERPDKPFDRDTELRLTGPELARRGVADLAQALAYLPEIQVRDVARGGRQIDVRGARKGSVKVLVDGVPVADPYRGNLDLSAIPVTDIVEIRVSTTPASPIDGTGGPGGLIEVHTRDAVGARLLGVRLDAGTLRAAMASATGNAMLGDRVGVRVSATGDVGARDLSAVDGAGRPATLDEARRAGAGSLRIEYRHGARRAVGDVSVQTGRYVVPPSESETGQVVEVDASHDVRVGASVDDELGGFRVQARAYGGTSAKTTRFYPDADRETRTTEEVRAVSVGGGLLANRPVGAHLQLIGSGSLERDAGSVDSGFAETDGAATLAALAGGFAYDRGALRVAGAAGLAAPIGLDATPWPEAKLTVKASPHRAVTLRLVGAHKGRLPTLRERFEGGGNEALGPEKALFAEVGVALERNDWIGLDAAGWVRRSNGMIRFDPDAEMLRNVGVLTLRGVDLRGTWRPYDPIRAGAGVAMARASSGEFGEDVVDRLPRWRGDAWLAGDAGERGGGVLRVRYVGSMIDQGARLPSYWLVEATSWLRLTGDVQASLRVDNALDRRYADRAGGFVGAGRSAVLSVQGTWD